MSTPPQGFGSTVAAGVIGSDEAYRALLQSIVEVARAIFAAQAASIMLYDVDAHELVFEAAAGQGQEPLVGQRVGAGTRDRGLGAHLAGADDRRGRHARPALRSRGRRAPRLRPAST